MEESIERIKNGNMIENKGPTIVENDEYSIKIKPSISGVIFCTHPRYECVDINIDMTVYTNKRVGFFKRMVQQVYLKISSIDTKTLSDFTIENYLRLINDQKIIDETCTIFTGSETVERKLIIKEKEDNFIFKICNIVNNKSTILFKVNKNDFANILISGIKKLITDN